MLDIKCEIRLHFKMHRCELQIPRRAGPFYSLIGTHGSRVVSWHGSRGRRSVIWTYE